MLPTFRASTPARRLLGALVMLAAAAGGPPLLAQNEGGLDPRYSGDGVTHVQLGTTIDPPDAVACGMPVVTGFSVVSGQNSFFIARFFMHQIFGDDFEVGNTKAFSAASQ